MKRTAEQAAHTRARLLDAALEVFARRGYAAATLGEIGAAAHLTRGAVYHHFADKLDLYESAVAERWAQIGDSLRTELMAPGDPADRLRAFLVRFLTAVDSEPAMQELLVVTMGPVGPELSDDGAGFDLKQKAMGELLDQIATICRDARDSDALRAGVVPEVAARVVLAHLAGAVVLQGVGIRVVPDGADVADVAAAALAGILAPPPIRPTDTTPALTE